MAQTVSLLLSAQHSADLERVIEDRRRPVKHAQRAQIILLSAERLPVLVSWRSWGARWCGIGLRALGLALLVAAVAGPRWPDLRTRIDTEGIAIMMLVDVSGSMGEKDFDWDGERISRLDAVKRCFRLFVEGGRAGEAPEALPENVVTRSRRVGRAAPLPPAAGEAIGAGTDDRG